MADEDGVNVPDSPPGKEGDYPSPEGKKGVDRSPDGLLKLKDEVIQTLKVELGLMKDELSELKEISSRRGLNSSEKSRQDELEDDIDESANKLEKVEGNAAWIHLTKKKAQQAALEIATDSEIQRANDFIDDKAFELEMSEDELTKAIRPYAVMRDGKSLYRRNVEAFRSWQKEQKRIKGIEDREKNLKDREEEEQRFKETGQRQPRDESADQQWNEADKKGKTRLLVDLLDSNSAPVSIPK